MAGQIRVKSDVQTFRTESGMDFKIDSGSLGLYLQHNFKNHYRRVERLLKIYMRIARLCRSLIVLISLLV